MSSQHAIDLLAYHHARPDDLGALLYRRRPKFDSARQFGQFCRLVHDHDVARPGAVSPTSAVIDIMMLGCIVDASPPAWTPSPIPYHESWIRHVHQEAELDAGPRAVRAWVAADVGGQTVRSVADVLGVGRTLAASLIDTGRLAVEQALIRFGYLHQ